MITRLINKTISRVYQKEKEKEHKYANSKYNQPGEPCVAPQ
jgi:hypothetical protein